MTHIGARGLIRCLAILPTVIRAFSGQRQGWKIPRWAWDHQVRGMLTFSLQCSDTVGWATGRASGLCISWVLECWWWRFDWSFARLIAPFHHQIRRCFSDKIQNGGILVPAKAGLSCMEKRPLNECCCGRVLLLVWHSLWGRCDNVWTDALLVRMTT